MKKAEPAHSRLGASSAERWLNCPGSVALCATLPPPPESPYAAEGTAAHYVAERCLHAGHEPEEFLGRFYTTKGGHKVELTEDLVEAVRVYVDHVRAVGQMYPDKVAEVEQRVVLDKYDGELFGTCDCMIAVRKIRTLFVFDYKHGAGKLVDPEMNPQCMYYALGALLRHPNEIDRVVITIVQPRCAQAEYPVRSWETTAAALYDFGVELMFGAAATRQPDAPLNPGKWCQFCPASGSCPKLYEGALEAAGVDFADVNAEPIDFKTLTPEELGKRLALADKLKAWLAAIQKHAFAEATQGRIPAGFKVVAKRGTRQWLDPDQAMQLASLNFEDVDPDDLFKRKAISPAELEKLVGKKRAEPIVEAMAETRSSGLKLAPLSAKGEPVQVGALGDFADIGELFDDE